MAPLPVLEKSRPVANPSAGRDTYDMPTGVNLQSRNATPRWHRSVAHDARQNSRARRGKSRQRRTPGEALAVGQETAGGAKSVRRRARSAAG
jgi:hypothetical protein